MEGFLKKAGSTAVRFSLKALVSVCTGILAVIEAVRSTEKGGGK